MKKGLLFCALLLFVVTSGISQDLMDDEDGDDDDLMDDLLDKVYDEESSKWWNKEWKYRRRIEVTDPEIPVRGVVLLDRPDPLLLYNTGRCLEELADLRVISREGKALPSGVLNFGRDDGSSYIWCRPHTKPTKSRVVVYLYYGNPSAKSAGHRLTTAIGEGKKNILVDMGAEGVLEGAKLPARAGYGAFFSKVASLEAERFVGKDKDGKSIVQNTYLPGASGGQVLTVRGEYQGDQVTATDTVEVQEAGAWRVHVRYRIGEEGKNTFTATLAGKEFPCEAIRERSRDFGWTSFDAQIEAGEHEIGVRFPRNLGLDCMILTQDESYRPDYRDVSGPMWMRFKMVSDSDHRFYIHVFGWHTTYSAEGAKGDTSCWLFRDRVVVGEAACEEIAGEDEAQLAPGIWSPWGLGHHSGQYTWFSEISFLPKEEETKARIKDFDVVFECATRPDSSRAVVSGTEEADASGRLRIRMPTSLAYQDGHGPRLTESFGQWAKRRFKLAKDLGLKGGRGPKHIVAGTMAGDLRTPTELEYFFKTSNWLGFNLMDTYYHDQALLRKLAEQYGMPWHMNHHTAFGVGCSGLKEPEDGKTYDETFDECLGRNADAHYRRLAEQHYKGIYADGRAPRGYGHIRYGIFNDEVQEVINSLNINADKLLKNFFVEYMEKHGITPEFLGVEDWEELRAVDYAALHPKTVEKLEKRMKNIQALMEAQKALDEAPDSLGGGDDGEGELVDELLDEIDTTPKDEKKQKQVKKLSKEDQDFLVWVEEVMKNRDRKENKAKGLTSPEEKRVYHWTQRFKNHYYCMFYRNVSKASKKNFPADFTGGVNLQPHPGWLGEMFGGECSLFEVGRLNAFNCIQWEDWNCGTLNVAFGTALTRAGARKNSQEVSALIVGHHPRRRVMADIANGVRYMIFYLYGPVHRIGPVWAEDPPTIKDIGEIMAQIGKCEEDILAASPRRCDAALLVANTSEINATYGKYGFGGERLTLFGAMLNAQVPVELIGEEEVIHDGILDNYRVLYVGDSHVDSRAQEKIRRWVEKGGVLWASLPAFMRQEYDDWSEVMNEALGITGRKKLAPFPGGKQAGQAVSIRGEDDKLFAPCGFLSTCPRPEFGVGKARALGTFEDGSAALAHNKLGKGQAFLAGFMLSRMAQRSDAGKGETVGDIQRNLVSVPARAAGVRSHVTVDAPRLWVWVHDGPEQTVTYLINESGKHIKTDMKIAVERPVVSAYSGLRDDVVYKADEDQVSVPLDLPIGECEILVLKH